MRVQLNLLFFILLAPAAASAQEHSPFFRDDLLEHLVGKWNAAGIVHGTPSRQTLEAEWVLNHQFLRVTQKSVENVTGQGFPFEGVFYLAMTTPASATSFTS
jgi:hypothetical protein